MAQAESFESLLTQSLETNPEGKVLCGKVLAIENELAVVDVGLKSEGRIPIREFSAPGQDVEISVGDEIDVFVERYENKNGEVMLSREKARREESWAKLEVLYGKGERVQGRIFGRVKGGFTVDLDGAIAFLPGSQVDIRPVRDVSPLMESDQPFQILKMDRPRGNIVVSRRAVLEETRAEQRADLISSLKEGQVMDGVVKNITDYGAFVDLGGIDGLLHVTDVSWKRINHPSEVLDIGQTVKVQIVKFNSETQRISLGMKQLESDPWDGVEAKYPSGTRFKGRVTNITDYGAFVELEPGIEGLVHVSEMSWTKKNVHPGKIVSSSQEVEVQVLLVDTAKRRVSLGLKQTMPNPWEAFAEKHPDGSRVEGPIKNITEFGLFIGLDEEIDGMIHLSDLDWNRSAEEAVKDYKKGDQIKAVVLRVDVEKERISLGVKQLEEDPFKEAEDGLTKGAVVTGTVSAILEGGIEVELSGGLTGFIRKSDLSRDRAEQRTDRFAVGEKVDAKITQFDPKARKITLSIKANEVEEEKAAMSEFGSTRSGASLGNILGAALSKAKQEAGKSTESNESTEPAEQASTKSEDKGEDKGEGEASAKAGNKSGESKESKEAEPKKASAKADKASSKTAESEEKATKAGAKTETRTKAEPKPESTAKAASAKKSGPDQSADKPDANTDEKDGKS